MAVKFTPKGSHDPPDAETYREAIERLTKAVPTVGDAAVQAAAQMARAADRAWLANTAQIKQWIETAGIALARAEEEHRKLRQSAVFAVQWTEVLLADLGARGEGDPPFVESNAIGWVLEKARDKGDALAGEILAGQPPGWEFVGGPERFDGNAPLGYFVAVLREHVAAMRDAVGMGDGAELPDTEDDATRAGDVPGDPLLWLDGRFAAWLEETFPKTGPGLADDVRRRARGRWVRHRQTIIDGEPENGRLLRLWIDLEADAVNQAAEQFPFLLALTRAAWLDVVRPKLEAERRSRERYAPAIGTGQLDLLARAAFDTGRTVEIDPDGRGASIKDSTGKEVARLAGVDAGVLTSIEREIRERQRVSVDFLRVFGGLVTEGHRQKAGDPDGPRPDRLIVPGGWGGLCELVHVPNQTRVRKAFQYGRALELPSPGGGEILGLWKGELIRDRKFGKRYARLVIDLSRWLLPPRRGEQLVPILPPDREPALPADRKLTAPALLLVQYLLQHFRTHAEQLLRDGTVPISEEDWIMMARRADLHRLDAVRGPLEQGTDDRPPLLLEVAPDRFDLAEPYADVRRFLLEGGKKTRASRERGRKAQRKKDAAQRKRKRRKAP